MKMIHRVAVALSVLALTAAPQLAFSAGPTIAASSCGGAAAGAVPNAYCSFSGTGNGVVIEPNSCNKTGSCGLLGDGVQIGHDSCNGNLACDSSGSPNG